MSTVTDASNGSEPVPRRDEPLKPEFIRKIKNEHSSTMPVIDPEGAETGAYTIFLPWESVYDTQGLHRYGHYSSAPLATE